MIHNPTFIHQSVDRVQVLAFLKDGGIVQVDAIIINDILSDIELHGKKLKDFQSLEDDVRATLDESGFKGIDSHYRF